MAESRTIRTVLELNAQRFNQGAASAAASARKLSSELAAITDASGKQRADFDRVSNTLLGVGAAAATGLGLATKASMDWESAWAGVTKTIEGTPAQLSAVEDGLRGLARELPASHTEIAAVAEAAGALGVQTDSVVGFTETMINLGETTNLTSDEAATSLARFSNIMGTSQDDVDRLGAALVGLGNAGASTEQEIMQMGLRLAGVGSQVGLTEGEVLGLANAMSSVGIEAEAGGTAMSMGMKKIQKAVDEGGAELEGFAEVAGMSAEEFARLWSTDSAAGLDAFVQGLARVSDEGGNVSTILSDLGLNGIRESDTFLRLAGASDMLSDSLAQGNVEFEKNLALVTEATKRYETTESQLQIARNAIVDAGIDLGSTVLPILADAAGGIADLAGWFAELPAPVQTSVTHLGGMVAVTGLVGGGLLKLVPAAMDTVTAFRDLRSTSPGVASALGRVGKAVAVTGVALTGLAMLSDYGDSLTDFAIGANEAADMALRSAESLDPLSVVFAGMGEDAYLASASTEEMAANLDVLANGSAWGAVTDKAAGLANAFGAGVSTLEDSRQRLEEYGQGLAALAQTDLPQATAAFENLWVNGFGGTEQAGIDLLNTMPTLRDELIGLANEAGLATDDTTLLKIASGELVPVVDDAAAAAEGYAGAQGEAEGATEDATDAVDEQREALAELQDVLQDTAELLLGQRDAAREYEAAMDDATKAVEENGKTLDITTEAGRANQEALDSVAQAAHELANSAEESGASAEELDKIMRDGRETFIETAESMGMSRDEATKLADELQLIPDFVSTKVEVETQQAQEELRRLWVEQGLHPPQVVVTADTSEAQEEVHLFTGTLQDGPPGTVPVTADVEPAEEEIGTIAPYAAGTNPTVTVTAETEDAKADIGYAAKDQNTTITADAQTSTANSEIDYAARDRTATVRVVATGLSSLRAWGAGFGSGKADGGWLNEGLNSGGWVPGAYPGPGVDNVLWPVRSGLAGGGMALQPLAGTEFVVRGSEARKWGPALEAMNEGISRAELAAMFGAQQSGTGLQVTQNISGLTAYDVARESTTQMRHVVREQAVPLTGG